jgi:hypothetical protein
MDYDIWNDGVTSIIILMNYFHSDVVVDCKAGTNIFDWGYCFPAKPQNRAENTSGCESNCRHIYRKIPPA